MTSLHNHTNRLSEMTTGDETVNAILSDSTFSLLWADAPVRNVPHPAELLERVSTPCILARTLRRLLADDEVITEVALRSYEHANGFDKIVLVETTEPRVKLRLHIWWPESSAGEGQYDAHNHCWDFWSMPLTGQFVHEKYEISDHGRIKSHYAYTPRGERAYFELRSIGERPLVRFEDSIILPREPYFLAAGVIHRFYCVRNVMASSLVIQGPKIREGADIFVSKGPTLPTVVESPSLSIEQLRTKISLYLGMFSAPTYACSAAS